MSNEKRRRQEAGENHAHGSGRNFSGLDRLAKESPVCAADLSTLGKFYESEIFGLTQQLRRAAVSIPANIAEGFKRRGRTDKARFMNIAQGSLEEPRYYLILAMGFGYLDGLKLLENLEEIGHILGTCSRTLRSPASCLLPPVS